MHEYSIVAELVDQVAAAAAGRRVARVHRVQVAIGEWAGVDVDLLALAFETFRDGTICAGAVLDIERPAGDEIILQRVEMEVSDV
ncbi:MAG TPA: hydrogenase maturation nickel metallochaperone HypA [Kofleriaceae bacterium]|jgi:Zn finger protein HypA/HybF involved in hydrogenase expression|nr:hydrogenase maturation nickel metallochaperone HypA [Kofleriaceae bacterium]